MMPYNNGTTRIGLTLKTTLMKMSEGNPGCLMFLCEMLDRDVVCAQKNILALDTLGLYGSKAYMLWNDCCERDVDKVSLVLDCFRKGELSAEEIYQHLSGGWGEPFDNLTGGDKNEC